jgi:plasmid stabilization system protein ParE
MAVEIVMTPEAEQDLSEAYDWYEQRRVGLGEDFLARVDAVIQGISRLPEFHPIVHENYRRAVVRKFPYVVFYEYAGGKVTVYCVFHTSQDPDKWRQRLPER